MLRPIFAQFVPRSKRSQSVIRFLSRRNSADPANPSFDPILPPLLTGLRRALRINQFPSQAASSRPCSGPVPACSSRPSPPCAGRTVARCSCARAACAWMGSACRMDSQASCRSLLSLGSTPDLVPERVFEGSFTQTAQVQLAPRGPEDRAASKARERNVSMQTYVQTLCKYVYERTCGHAQGGPQRSGIRGDWRHRVDGMEAREAREAKAGVEVVSSIASEDSP